MFQLQAIDVISVVTNGNHIKINCHENAQSVILGNGEAVKTKYEFIHFDLIEKKAKTFVIGCYNNKTGAKLGVVKWYSVWRQYCYFPITNVVYSAGCLDDIRHFLKQTTRLKLMDKGREVDLFSTTGSFAYIVDDIERR